MFKKGTPVDASYDRRIPVGSCVILDDAKPIAVVLGQSSPAETQRYADLMARAEDVRNAIAHLDHVTHAGINDVSVANAWRDLRRAIAGEPA